MLRQTRVAKGIDSFLMLVSMDFKVPHLHIHVISGRFLGPMIKRECKNMATKGVEVVKVNQYKVKCDGGVGGHPRSLVTDFFQR